MGLCIRRKIITKMIPLKIEVMFRLIFASFNPSAIL